LGLPVSGNSARTLRDLINKPAVKRRLQQHGLPTPAFPEDGAQGKQWILKSETFHCSRGMDHRNVSSDIEALNRLARECAHRYSGAWFLEEYIPGREINIALLDNGTGRPDILPASEIHFTGREPHIVDYDSKWNENSESYAHTTPGMIFSAADKPLLDKLGALSQQCWQHFNLSGYARVDFRIDKAGNPFILEINANPCLSEDAGFMRAAQHAGLSPADVIWRLIPPLPVKRAYEVCTA
jgi:D-alanine-D-alanine ligase